MNIWDTLDEIDKIATVVCWDQQEGDYTVTATGDKASEIIKILKDNDIWYEAKNAKDVDNIVNIDICLFRRGSVK